MIQNHKCDGLETKKIHKGDCVLIQFLKNLYYVGQIPEWTKRWKTIWGLFLRKVFAGPQAANISFLAQSILIKKQCFTVLLDKEQWDTCK